MGSNFLFKPVMEEGGGLERQKFMIPIITTDSKFVFFSSFFLGLLMMMFKQT